MFARIRDRLPRDRRKQVLLIIALLAAFFLALWNFRIRLPEVAQLAIRTYGGEELASYQLRELGPRAVPSLAVMLRSDDLFLRKLLWHFSPRFPRPVQRYLFQKIGYPQKSRNREAAAHALALLGPAAAEAVPELADALRDPAGRVRWKAAEALGRIGAPAVPALIHAVSDPDRETRHAAAFALGVIGPPAVQAAPALLERLKDDSQGVRDSAADSLRRIGAAPSESLLKALRHPETRSTAVAALHTYYGSRGASVTNLLALARKGPDDAQLLAIQTMAAAGLAHNDVLDLLAEFSTNASPDLRQAADAALQTLAPQRPDRFPVLAP